MLGPERRRPAGCCPGGIGAAVARRQRRRKDEREGHDWEGATRAVCGHQGSSIARRAVSPSAAEAPAAPAVRQRPEVGDCLILRLSGAPVYGCRPRPRRRLRCLERLGDAV